MKRKLAPLLLLSLLGCAHAPQPPSLTRDREVESLERAVAWPHASPRTILLLANGYLARNRVRAGFDTFSARAQASPEQPIFLALTGLFQARLAGEIPLLHRVDWVEEAAARLDRAAAQGGLPRYLRGIVFADLPSRFGRAAAAAGDLEWMLAHSAAFPPGLRRGAWRGLGKAYTTLGRSDDAARAFAKAGGRDAPALAEDGTVSTAAGFRFVPRELAEVAPNVFVARGYDFADIAFIVTGAGVVAIDAGTTRDNAAAALAAFRARSSAPITHVIITHAHWDHIGGLQALLAPDTKVIARANFADELAHLDTVGVPFRGFFGAGFDLGGLKLAPTHVVAARETLTVGDTRLVLEPTRGGETEDALLVHLPESGTLFVGDAFMPYFGAPFVAEGSVDGLLDTIAQIRALAPQKLIHGHPPLTLNFPVEILPALGDALAELRAHTLAQLRAGRTESEALAEALLPERLRDSPDAVIPYLLMRDNLIGRLYQQRSGYWKPDGAGMEVYTRAEQAAAFDLLGGGRAAAFERAAASLSARGDFGMAMRIADLGLAAHPDNAALGAERRRALEGLRARYQFNPFKFIIYSELAGDDVAPLE
jgi:glyoxylase-like metal-dependent hydrolase (beta-lactamase superfamily II)